VGDLEIEYIGDDGDEHEGAFGASTSEAAAHGGGGSVVVGGKEESELYDESSTHA